MEPAVGVCRKVDSCATTSTVCLTRSTLIPANVAKLLRCTSGEAFAVDTELALLIVLSLQCGSIGNDSRELVLTTISRSILNKADVSSSLP